MSVAHRMRRDEGTVPLSFCLVGARLSCKDCRKVEKKRVGERRGGVGPSEPMLGEGEAAEGGRTDGERMDGRAQVVVEPGERQLRGPRSSPDCALGFENGDGKPRASENDSSGETVGPGTRDKDLARTGHGPFIVSLKVLRFQSRQKGNEKTMRYPKFLAALAFGVILTASAASAEIVVRVGPPRPRVERRIAAPGPGYVWIGGFYRWEGGAHVWVPGRWERPIRPGAVWVAPRWQRRGREWVFIDGRWR